MTRLTNVFSIVLGRYICIGAVTKWPFSGSSQWATLFGNYVLYFYFQSHSTIIFNPAL